MTAAPLVTVLIDTYNYGRYIESAVKSVLTQNFPAERREILIIDDGSTDDTSERLQKFGNAVRYLKKANGGQASALNLGFEQTRGEIVALLDADDVWLPEKLEKVVRAFAEHPDAGLVYHRFWEVDTRSETRRESGLSLVSGRIASDRRRLLRYHMYPASTLAFRRAALNDILPIPLGLTFQADAYLTALVIFRAPVVALSEVLADYRVHGENLFHSSGAISREQLARRMKTRQVLVDAVHAWLSSHGHHADSGNIRTYLKQWEFSQESDRFKIDPPGRWELFRHRCEDARVYGELRSWRHRLSTYVGLLTSLLLGYRGERSVGQPTALEQHPRRLAD